MSIAFHTRHIPEEHLKPEYVDEYRERVMINLTPENIQTLKDAGIETVELRLVWWELEPEPGVLDWSRFDRDIKTLKENGLKAGLMAWFNHPPEWYLKRSDRAAFFMCHEHGLETTTLSLWDPETLKIMERLYSITAEKYRDSVDFVYITSCGDYGEPMLPTGVRKYKFSSPHSHASAFWARDKHAQHSWRAYLSEKYQSLSHLNESHKTTFLSWDDISTRDVIDSDSVQHKIDYSSWLAESTATYTARIYRLIKKFFPKARTGVPIGAVDESRLGQWKSLCVKKLAEVSTDFTARWTGMALYGDFPRGNVLAKRVSSAARFYGAKFGGETAYDTIKPDIAVYECVANGATMIHDDLASVRRGEFKKYLNSMIYDPPVCRTAAYFPIELEMLRVFEEKNLQEFNANATELRRLTDYEITDSLMIADGFLDHIDTLIFVISSPVPSSIVHRLEEFIRKGGRVIAMNDSVITILETGADAPFEYSGKTPCFDEYVNRSGHETFTTIHRERISEYFPEQRKIVMEKRAARGV